MPALLDRFVTAVRARVPAGLLAALAAYATWRLTLIAIWLETAGTYAVKPGVKGFADPLSPFAAFHRWDSMWFLSIMEQGYWYDPNKQSPFEFYPLYPMFAKALVLLGIPNLVATLLISHVALVVALWGLWELTTKLVSEDAAPRALIALLVFPTGIFLTAAYTESLFLAFATWAFVLHERGRFLPAAVLAMFATVTRGNGAILAASLGLAVLVARNYRAFALYALLPGAAFAGWLAYQGVVFGDPLAFIHTRALWLDARPLDASLAHLLANAQPNRLENLLDWAATAGLIAAIWPAYKRLGLASAAFIGLTVLAVAPQQVWGMGRFALSTVPLFPLLADYTKRPAVARLLLAISLPICVIEGVRFIHGYWVD